MISNATPLILLSRINQLELLKKTFSRIFIPPAVKEEVLVEGKPGTKRIQEALKDGWLIVQKPKQAGIIGLGKGEEEAIALAKEKKGRLLIDDRGGIKAAQFYGVETIRSTTVFFIAAKKKIIKPEQITVLLNELIQEGYYIKPEEYAFLISQLQK